MQIGDIVVICCPTSPNDGKRATVLQLSDSYVASRDEFDKDYMTLAMLDTGIVGTIHRRHVSEVQ